MRAGMTVCDMAYFAARDDHPSAVCIEAVAAADVFVGVLGMRYGSLVKDRRQVSYTEMEFDTATERDLPRLMFLLDERERVPLPASALIDRRHGDRQDAFRTRVREAGMVVGFFATVEQLQSRVYQALIEHRARLRRPTGKETVWGRRSRYVQQVRDIAPVGGTLGREEELAELTAFCAADDIEGGSDAYVWWQAPPWAGKSALMSTFVLNPPPGVRVLSFFITGRLVGQAHSTAFTDALLDQACVLTGEDLPGSLSPAQRDMYRRDLLEQAAAQAVQQGERLVLVVDGLDEDRGARAGSGIGSIASLLPKQPPHGMRVILAGRPAPPIPGDVPADHPIRWCRRRLLAPSQHARRIADLARRELDELLTGNTGQRDLIGFITASGGALTLSELQELTKLAAFEVENMLHGVCGRTVAGRADNALTTNRRVFLFTHETLRAQAVERLGHHVAVYRERIHSWIEGYRGQGWPSGTPVYALYGYYQMLTDQNDLSRMLHLAVDPRRHDRMLDIIGGDTAALAEIRTLQSLHLRTNGPDLYAMARLCVRRNALADRNAYIPTDLPAVWARIGDTTRAEALARAITKPLQLTRVLAALLDAVADVGDHDRATALIDDAEITSRAITDLFWRAQALTAVARAVAKAGHSDRAATIARSIAHPDRQARALTVVARAAAEAGERDRARAIARSIADPFERARALTALAQAAARADDHEQAAALAREAEAVAHTITHPGHQKQVLAELAQAVDEAGKSDRPATTARSVEREQAWAMARSIVDPFERARALTALAQAAATAGDHEQAAALAREAEAVAHTITHPNQQTYMLAAVVEAAAKAGDHDRATTIAHSIADPYERARALTALFEAVAGAGDRDRAGELAREAEEIAHTIAGPYERAGALVALFEAVAGAGDRDLAAVLAQGAEAIARTISHPDQRAQVLTELSQGVAKAGDHDRATTIAYSIADPYERARASVALFEAVARAGDRDLAAVLVQEAEAFVYSITDPNERTRALTALFEAVTRVGDRDRAAVLVQEAEALVHSITDPYERARALTALLGAVTGAGDPDRAAVLAQEAEATAHTVVHPYLRARALTAFLDALAGAGDRDRAAVLAQEAVTIAHTIAHPHQRMRALTDLSQAVAKIGDYERAATIARSISYLDQRIRALTVVVRTADEAGDHDRATMLAREAELTAQAIADPDQQAEVLAELASSATSHFDMLLGTVLAMSTWRTCVDLLVNRSPAAAKGLFHQVAMEQDSSR